MSRRRHAQGRQCPRCSSIWPGSYNTCPNDGTDLVRRRWKMTPDRHRMLRGLAFTQKGLTDEQLHDRMAAITGRTSTRDLTRKDFWNLVYDLKKLPNVERGRVA